MKKVGILIFILTAGCFGFAFSQNSSCAGASPYCTGQTMNYPATTGVSNSQPMPPGSYGCLGSQPNPAWFFMQMSSSGPMSIAMSAATDIDFICWGPFPTLSTACSSINSSNIQSCSYSSSPTETCTIANAVPGQFYVMLITNFSNQAQNITFNQTNQANLGSATTNCGFVCVVSGTTGGPVCAGQNATVSMGPGTSTSVISYTWTGPGGFSSTSFSNIISSVQNNQTYTVVGTNSANINNVPYSGTCQAVVTVSVIMTPTFNMTQSTPTICQGGNFVGGAVLAAGLSPGNYSYSWQPPSGAGQIYGQSTIIQPPLSPLNVSLATLVYTLTVFPTSTLVSCPVTRTLAITINNPLTPTLTPIPPVCNTFTAVQLTASPSGGIWSGNAAVTTGGLFTPGTATIGQNFVSYGVNVGVCIVNNTLGISVSKYYSPALTSGINTVCVQDAPINLMNIVQNTISGSWGGLQVAANIFNPGGLTTGVYSFTYFTTSLPNLTVCPASTVLTVPVFNPPTPTISLISPQCSNSGTVQLTAIPANGVWSGATGVSPAGVQTPSGNFTAVPNNVGYSVGQGTCLASSSKTFQVFQFNSAALTGTVGHLCATNNPVNLMSIVQNTNGSWSGAGVYTNSFTPTNLPSGIYSVSFQTQSGPPNPMCADMRVINVSVLNPPAPNITQVGPFCSAHGPMQLTVTPSTGQWIPSSYLSAGGTFSPGISPVGNSVAQYVIGTTTCNSQQTKIISVEAFVSAAITASIVDQCATGQQVSLLPITISNTGNWTGPGISGTSFNPAASGSGQFTLTYNTSSIPSGLCPDKSIISVNVFSLATPVIKQIGPFCNNALPVQLVVTPVGGLFAGGVVGAVTTSGMFNPGLGLIGYNSIRYSISSGPCVAKAETHVSVEKFVSADFEKYGENAYCENNLAFNLNSLVQNPGGKYWSDGPGVTIGSSMFDPGKATIGINTVTYQTKSSPLGLCSDTKMIRIKVKGIPSVTATSSSYKDCAPLEVLLTSIVPDEGFGSWNLDDGTEAQKGLNLVHLYNSPGSYTVVFNYQDGEAKGCATQVVLAAINVWEKPKADFIASADEITIANPQVAFTNLSTNLSDNKYTWSIPGMQSQNGINCVVNFTNAGSYKVTLTAINLHDCKDEVTRIVEVKNDFNIFIPNSFTPNFDGVNDEFLPVFTPYGLDTKSYSLEIFDRWGHELFSSKEHTKGWNGTVENKGDEPLKEETYVFRLKYKDLNGKVYNETGKVLLLR